MEKKALCTQPSGCAEGVCRGLCRGVVQVILGGFFLGGFRGFFYSFVSFFLDFSICFYSFCSENFPFFFRNFFLLTTVGKSDDRVPLARLAFQWPENEKTQGNLGRHEIT